MIAGIMTLQEPPSKENMARAFDQRVGAARAAFDAGRVAEAAQLFAELARDFPSHPLPHANLGMTLRRLGKLEAAVASYQRALALAPENPGIMSSLGNALRALGRLSEAEKLQARAVELAPRERALRYNHALTLRDMRKLNEALRLLAALNQEDPNDAEVAWDLALTQLQLGDYAKGFRGYENRWRLARNETKLRDPPHWQGEDISGKRILLQSEQGFSDALQFARYVPLVAARGARVVLECLAELKSLFAGIEGVEQVVLKGEAVPPVDLSIPLLGLARIFGTTLATIPREVPYLRAPQARLPRRPGTRLQIGLVWAGKPTPRDRSWPLPVLAPLLDDPRIAFYSLQVGPRAAELGASGLDRLVVDLSPHLKDFSATAAAMNALDLIVTVDTAAAHLAGALGRPVFVLLRYVSDWRWMDYRDDSPWYPTMRLFRQPRPDDFLEPVERVRQAIAQFSAAATKPQQ
jgi:Tfp pilus assembly protein PilF